MIKGQFRIPRFDLKKLDLAVFNRGLKVQQAAGTAYVRAGVKEVAIDTGMAVSAFTPLSRVLKINTVDAEIGSRQKRPFRVEPPRSPFLGAIQSGVVFNIPTDLRFEFTIFSGIEHLILLENQKFPGVKKSPFKSRKAGRAAYVAVFRQNVKLIFPKKSDRVIRRTIIRIG